MIEYSVKSIKPQETYDWLLNKHYAKRIPIIIYAFGLYDDVLQGVCTFSYPCRMLMQSFPMQSYELSRLVINEKLGKNVLSFFVANSLKMLPRPSVVVSYADSNQNHHGYIYQATNWVYTGLSSKEKKVFIDGKLQHRRTLNSLYNTSSIEELRDKNLDVEIEEQEGKHRYFYFLGKKKVVAKMKDKLKYPILPYPKGDNKRYDASYTPSVQTTLF